MMWLVASLALAGTVVDARGNEISVSAPARIVSLGGGVTEVVYALGAGDKVVGVDASSVYPHEVWRGPARLKYHRQLTTEGLLALAPDLVIATTSAGPPAALEQVRSAGVPVVMLDDTASVEAAAQRITDLGALLDADAAAAGLVQTLRADLAGIGEPAAPKSVLFIYARGGGTLNVAGSDTAAQTVIELAGGNNALKGYSGYKPLTSEGLVAAAPDVILLTTKGLEALGGAEGVLQQPGVLLTPAGQQGRIVSIEDSLLLSFGPRLGKGAAALAEALAE